MAKRCNAIRDSLLRSLVRHRTPIPVIAISPVLCSPPPASAAPPPPSPFPTPLFNSRSFSSSYRSFSSASDSDTPSNIVVIKSEKELSDVYKKAEDESLPTIFYFTAEWCGPCRLLWPNIKELSKEIDHVKIYKIDIDLDGLGHFLGKLNISSVPTLHFFSNGKKVAEVVGADSSRIRNVVSQLYSKKL